MTFDLELAKKTMTAQVKNGTMFKIVAISNNILLTETEEGVTFVHDCCGKCILPGKYEYCEFYQLINVPEPKKKISGWKIIRLDDELYSTKEIAQAANAMYRSRYGGNKTLGLIHIEFEEGEGLE